MKKATPPKPKTITPQKVIGEQGVAIVRELLSAMGLVFHETGQLDAGIDGFVELRDPDTGAVRAQFVGSQVKTKEQGVYTRETVTSFEYLCDPSDLEYWRGSNIPVILIMVRLEDRSVYWKLVDPSIQEADSARRLKIDKEADALSEAAFPAIAQAAIDRAQPGTFLPAPRLTERHDLNVIHVVAPEFIYVASTDHATREKAMDALFDRTEAPPYAWTLRGGQIASFQDLSEPPLSWIVDGGTVERFAFAEFGQDRDEPEFHLVVELLYKSLQAQLAEAFDYDASESIFFFPADKTVIEYKVEYESAARRASCWAVKKYLDKANGLSHVRHRGFAPYFLMIGGEWFLAIEPAWKFTKDGTRTDQFAADRISWLKRKENNGSVRGQFFLWQSCLTDKAADYVDNINGHGLTFKKVAPFASARSVPDKFWLSRDDTPPPRSDDDGEDLDEEATDEPVQS